MTREEVGKLLALCTGFDRRTVGAADVLAWHEAFTLKGVTSFADARQAVIEHYSESDDFIMPVHVIRRAKAIRAKRLANQDSAAVLPQGDVADRPTAWLEELRNRIDAAADGLVNENRLALTQRRPTGAVLAAPAGYLSERAKLIPGVASDKAQVFQRLRQASLAVDCDYCPSNRGQVCRNTVDGRELTREPAHETRLVKCGAIEPPAAPRQLPPGASTPPVISPSAVGE
ncbi:hypothetical protein [Microbispora sp. NPDC049125]|uniref:hypothetical protein n=1 Tax=Microbispora sp. NPDC049125 TaxID=3154929 RepID=UPI00346532BE